MAGSGRAHMRPDSADKILSVEDLTVEFKLARDKIVKAVSGISFDVLRGETLAIVGESGVASQQPVKQSFSFPAPQVDQWSSWEPNSQS